MDAEDDLQVGGRIGRFRIVATLGAGASSVVYEGIDEDLERAVVLKVHRNVGDEISLRGLVLAEARGLAAVQHESVMPLLELFWHAERPVLVFPRTAGETLSEFLTARRCTLQQALVIVRDVARALSHAHGKGIFHHDVKPSNIWLKQEAPAGLRAAMLFDFGLTGAPSGTGGTPGYSDPLPTQEDVPEAWDLFLLGVVLHECLAVVPAVPQRCRDLVRRLTHVQPSLRPRASAVVVEIDRMLSPSRRVWPAAAAVLLAVCSFAFWIEVRRRLDRPSDDLVEAADDRILPQAVLRGGGAPVAVAGDARLYCFVKEGPVLCIRSLEPREVETTVSLAFRPDRLAFNPDADALAASDESGNVAIVSLRTGHIVVTHRFSGAITWIGWSGWTRDVLVVLCGSEVHGYFETLRPDGEHQSAPKWGLMPLRKDVSEVSTLARSEAVLSVGVDGAITIWSIGGMTEDTPLWSAPSDVSQLRRCGWKNAGVCFTTQGKKLIEHAMYNGFRVYDMPAECESITWTAETEYVILTRETSGEPRLMMGDWTRPDWSRAIDLGGERAIGMQLLEDRRRLAVFTDDGDVMVYSLRP